MYQNINSMNQEMNRMRYEMDKLFRQVASPSFRVPGGYPSVNTWADKDKMIVTAELLGILEINLERAEAEKPRKIIVEKG